jgi:hypothetical protein
LPPFRIAAVWLAGLWLGLLVASWLSATASFRAVDRVLEPGARPELEERLARVDPPDRRVVLRFLASEINRWMFARWALVQALLALVLFALVWNAGLWPRSAAALLLLVVAVQALGLGPQIESLGRTLDFVPRPLPADVARRFGVLHGSFVLFDLLKAVVLLVVGLLLTRAPHP